MSDSPPGEADSSSQRRIAIFFGTFMDPQHQDTFAFDTPEFGEVLVRSALNWREQASSEAQQAFNAAMRESGVRVQGFQNAERAPAFRLQEPVLRASHRWDSLAGAVLRIWAEANQSLHEAVVTHLEDRGLPTVGLDFPGGRFRGDWSLDKWRTEQDRLIQLHGDQFDRDDVALMLCYVSGNIPTLPKDAAEQAPSTVNSDVLDGCLAYLQELSPSAAQWERLIPDFVGRVGEIIREKEVERNLAANLDEAVARVSTGFSDELAYLEQDPESWSSFRLSPAGTASAALPLVTELEALLEEYRPVREQAPFRSEEQVRAPRRAELESSILSIADRIHGLLSGETGPEDSGLQPLQELNEESEADKPTAQVQAQEALTENTTATAETVRPSEPAATNGGARDQVGPTETGANPATNIQEDPGARAQTPQATDVAVSAVSEAEYTALQTVNLSLEQELRYLKDEAELLRDDLRDNQALAESWRLAYEKERQESSNREEPESRPIKDVYGAVRLAREKFREQIIFQPNSESEIEDNPFITPETVWKALQWLATTYYQSRIGNLREPDFDRSVREACGWWYKSDQHDTTMGRYPGSYTTRVDGRTYRLEEHIGKGTNWDARYTIRIAFDWDRTRRKVIVGYIGRHQRTDAS